MATEQEADIDDMADPRLDPHLFIVFGAGGDLSERKLMPALYTLMQQHEDLQCCHILGVARSDRTDEEYREEVRRDFREQGFTNDDLEQWCDRHVFYQPLGKPPDYDAVADRIKSLDAELDLKGNRVFYLALPPAGFAPTIRAISEHGLQETQGWTRLVVEKPFGSDLESARKLNALIHEYFNEDQVYRIDHYLGKETVQNLLVFRFANALFESVWNRERIERVEIVVEESIGTEGRGKYYDGSGALRDMIQNHLSQLLCLVAMEAPTRFDADSIRPEKLKVLESIRPIRPENVVFGQYTSAEIDGERVPGYLEEEGVPQDSRTETFVELMLEVSNWRWQGVPFVLRTGKRMPERRTQIFVRFRPAPISIFQPFESTCHLSPNVLIFTLQPNEGFDLCFEVKEPGDHRVRMVTQRLRFRYDEAFEPLPEAYETLLLDIMEGDQTLFVDSAWVEASWKLYDPILDGSIPIKPYPAGSTGPAQSATGKAAPSTGNGSLSESVTLS